eukprot:12062047-Heterocapsa_arctica.AAC.1
MHFGGRRDIPLSTDDMPDGRRIVSRSPRGGRRRIRLIIRRTDSRTLESSVQKVSARARKYDGAACWTG